MHSDNPFASPAANAVTAEVANETHIHSADIQFAGQLQQEDLDLLGYRRKTVSERLFLLSIICVGLVLMLGYFSTNLRESVGRGVLGALFAIFGGTGYVSFLTACFLTPLPNFKWWQSPVSGTITSESARLNFEKFSFSAPLNWFNVESTNSSVLLKSGKHKTSSVTALPRRWFSPEDFRSIESRFSTALAVETENPKSSPEFNPLDQLELEDAICVHKPGRLGAAIRSGPVVCSNGMVIAAFSVLILINAIGDGNPWVFALGASFVGLGILARLFYWLVKPNPPSRLDQMEILAWVTPEKLYVKVRSGIVEVDLKALAYSTNCNGRNVSRIPLVGALTFYQDMCPRGQWDELKQRLRNNKRRGWWNGEAIEE